MDKEWPDLIFYCVVMVTLIIFGIAVGKGIFDYTKEITSGKIIIIDNSSYKCKMINTLNVKE